MNRESSMARLQCALRSLRRRCWRVRSRRQMLNCALVVSLALTLSACVVRTPPTNFVCSSAGDAPRSTPPYSLNVTPPLAVDGVVYVGYNFPPPDGAYQRQYAIAALRASDGALLWRVVVDDGMPFTTPLAVADGVLIVGGSGLVGLRASDGAKLWEALLGAVAVTASGGVLYAFSEGSIAALQLTDGRILWQTHVQAPRLPSAQRGPFLDAPVVEGNAVYLAVGSGAVEALRADTGAVLWTVSPNPMRSQESKAVWDIPFAVAAGRLYVATNGELGGDPAGVLRLNPATGASDGYALRLPETTQPMYPLLLGGAFYIVLPAPQPSPVVAAYRLLARGAPLLWRVSAPAGMFFSAGTLLFAYDARTLYLLGDVIDGNAPHAMIAAFRISDGALLWSQRTLARRTPGIAATLGHLVDAAPGVTNPCTDPPLDQVAQIRALRSADGSVAWTRGLAAAA